MVPGVTPSIGPIIVACVLHEVRNDRSIWHSAISLDGWRLAIMRGRRDRSSRMHVPSRTRLPDGFRSRREHPARASAAPPGETSNTILAKLEGTNPAGSVKDRPALSMIMRAEERGEIAPGDTLIEATSGNTGIALAMVAAVRGYRMVLIMPSHMSAERRAAMTAYGAELVLVSQEEGMEGARDLAERMQAEGAREGTRSVRQRRQSRAPTSRARDPRSGRRRGARSPTSSAPWARPGRSWAPRVI